MDEQFYWLALSRMPGIGPVKVKRWLSIFQNVSCLFSASIMDLQQAQLTSHQMTLIKNVNWQMVERDVAWLEQHEGVLIYLTHPMYPARLREVADAPIVLYVQGDVRVLEAPQLAMVGSRHPTMVGIEIAEQFARELVAAGLVITSGLAVGVDGASHRGALAAGGKTIAVMGSGLQYIYPRSHQKLAEQIKTQGALVSEFPIDTSPKPSHFPARNRIISGLSLGVLVVEAAERSGSLITAACALEQNREVFAIPGSLRNPRARGCHQLIRQGAKLVEGVGDILEELVVLQESVKKHQKNSFMHAKVDLAPEMQRVYHYVGYEVTALDTITLNSGLTASQVSSMLLRLELEGCVRTVPGGYLRTDG